VAKSGKYPAAQAEIVGRKGMEEKGHIVGLKSVREREKGYLWIFTFPPPSEVPGYQSLSLQRCHR
jgi:hypothetical protein